MAAALPLCAQQLTENPPIRKPSPAYQAGDKKVIHLGWCTPNVTYWTKHIADVQGRPFDGITFHLGTDRLHDQIDGDSPTVHLLCSFTNQRYTRDEIDFAALRTLPWGDYNDNYLVKLGTPTAEFSWIDDALWNTVNHNARLTAEAIVAANARGLLFDPEYYGLGDRHPWQYSDQLYPDHTFEEVCRVVRQRGEAYGRSLMEVRDDFVFLTLWGYGIADTMAGMADDNIASVDYAMLPAFLDGMLDAAEDHPGFILVDGNEVTYYVDETRKAIMDYDHVRYHAERVIAPEHHDAWRTKHQVGMAIYPDYFYEIDSYAWGHPPQDHAKWMAHNVNHHLLVTDEFVWFWDEEYNWWPEPGHERWAKDIPVAVHDAAKLGRDTFRAGKALGYNMVKPIDSEWEPESAAQWVTEPQATLKISKDGRVAEVALDPKDDETAHTIRRVVFFVNSAHLGEVSEPPYRIDLPIVDSPKQTVWARVDTTAQTHLTTNPVTYARTP